MHFLIQCDKLPSIVRNTDGTMTVNLVDAKTPEIKMAAIPVIGLQRTALPEEIDEDFYNKLMDMDEHPEKKQAYLDSIAPRISKNALRATERRLNEAIEYAKQLKKNDMVYGAEQWKNYRKQNWMSPIESELKIRKSDNKTVVTVDRDLKCVNDFLIQNCPSYFKRDYVHLMFEKPKPAS